MPRLVYDFETDGLFADTIRSNARIKRVISKVHCLVVQDIDTGASARYHEVPVLPRERYHEDPVLPREGTLREGVIRLLAADLRTGHNIGDSKDYGYDERVLREFFPDLWATRNPNAEVLDTQVGAEVVWPFEWLKGQDATRAKRKLTDMPKALIGRHSLEAWGFRLGNRKDKYEGDFTVLDASMLSYCVQDVSSTRTLFLKILERIKAGRFSMQAWLLEQGYKREIELQQKNGVLFDMPAAEALTSRLQGRRAEIAAEMTVMPLFAAFEDVHHTDPKVIAGAEKRVAMWVARGNAAKIAAAQKTLADKRTPKIRVVPFNPGSRHHIARALQERQGWKPSKRGGYTPSGDVKIDETVLEGLRKYEGVDRLIEHFVVNKRLSQLAEPKKKDAVPWMKMVREDGRIHGKVRHNAAITNRCTHSSPNMTAVPRVGSPYGEECRSLFIAGPGNVLVGGDLKGIQLRGLAHFLVPIDGGEFRDEVLQGDPHNRTRVAIGLPEGKVYRDQAKTLLFATFFGAGAGKVMQILGCKYPRAKEVLDLLLKNRPALAKFKSKTGRLHFTQGCLNGLDGRYAFTRSAHSSIATALQLFEAVVVKQSTCLMHQRFRQENLQVRQVLCTHDEVTQESLVAHADRAAAIFAQSVVDAGEMLKSRCALAADVHIGVNWKEVHG